MHIDILSEDVSGKTALEILVPKIIDLNVHTFTIHSYKGIGKLPKKLGSNGKASHRILLDQLPRILQGFGRTHEGWGKSFPAAVVLVCDLDNRVLSDFVDELKSLLKQCSPAPLTVFCIAIEEGEAWLLGDIDAIMKAYPSADKNVLLSYQNDSICGTWETLADAVHVGGAANLKKQGFPASGKAKHEWAKTIAPHLDVEENRSPSFQYFRRKLNSLVSSSESNE
ncbi:hypothetical protein ACPROK_03305 [Glutamicibacter soli]|uniref:hypothetical protein n=1 Tax=Glutamicibacter soli TaxID=453836 RepID=UPI003C709CF1